ncbi:hypothetical protein D3C72_2337530 [compost metagenome]
MVEPLALLQQQLGGLFTTFFVALRPLLRQVTQARMATENPGVLVQHVPEQNRQAGNQRDGQPEAGQDAPEQ